MKTIFPRRYPLSPLFLLSLFSDLCSLCVDSFLSRSFRLSTISALACLLFLFSGIPSARSQDISHPLHSLDEDVTAFAYSPDGRIVYSIRRLFKTKKYDLQRDDIWLAEPNGKRRLLEGQKFILSDKPFSYTVDGFCWSPNGRMIVADLNTLSVVDDSGKTQEERMALVLEDNGKEIRIGGENRTIHNAQDAMWLQDNSTIVYLTEAIKPNILFSFKYKTLSDSPGGPLFEGRTFLGYDSLPRTNAVIAIERDRNLSGPPRIQRLDLLGQENQELATLDDYEGGLTVSPSGKRIAYYIDKEVLEIRDLASPSRVARLRVGFGTFAWAPDETAILMKRAPEKKSGDLIWVPLPPLSVPAPGHPIPVAEPDFVPLFHGLSFRDFAISPDGHDLAVIPPGQLKLMIFPLPPR
jgi:hypothetical protein